MDTSDAATFRQKAEWYSSLAAETADIDIRRLLEDLARTWAEAADTAEAPGACYDSTSEKGAR